MYAVVRLGEILTSLDKVNKRYSKGVLDQGDDISVLESGFFYPKLEH